MLMQTNIIQLWSNLLNPLQLTQREDSLERNVDFRSIEVKFCIRVELNFKVHKYRPTEIELERIEANCKKQHKRYLNFNGV